MIILYIMSMKSDDYIIYKYPCIDKRTGNTYMHSRKYYKKIPSNREISKTELRKKFNEFIKTIEDDDTLTDLLKIISTYEK